MYLDFYGLREGPFRQTPNPRFLYLGAGHREALAQLEYGLRERCGFLMLIGEVGSGKTTLLRTLLERLEPTFETALVFHTLMEFDDILRYVLEDFGVKDVGPSRAERMMALNRFLIEQRGRNRDTVLILDEAQNLSPQTLEEVRLLSNFETSSQKLLQIVLVGQPELAAKLQTDELRQVRQRISIRAMIPPLTREESIEYIAHRISVARAVIAGPRRVSGPRVFTPFTPRAVRRICRYAKGIPRVLNRVCDHSLVLGYGDQLTEIDTATVNLAIAYNERVESGDGSGMFAANGSRRSGSWLERWFS